ncbi:MAG: VCBS repeat-containing protein [Deltaproteobacteria bacterium]|jgi:hypothetical protein|nr:VCBS repeat-containing protein [Deltaproteobacteria bacterium]MBW2536787.1 VCBS repeat-containing protein [Deltaproteobacteria bacterium]
MRRLAILWFTLVPVVLVAGTIPACGDEVGTSDPCGGCPAGQICVDGQCVDSGQDGGTGGSNGDGGNLFQDGGGGCPPSRDCGDECCRDGEFCALGEACAVEQDPCTDNDDCWFDSYCLNGECIPYDVPAGHDHDEECEVQIDIDAIVPDVQCRWTGPPSGDAHESYYHVMSTPVVVDFDFDDQPGTLSPSIVFTSFPTAGSYSNPGVLRVIRGSDCQPEYSFHDAADATMSPAPVAVGDLDGDGRAEIVAAAHGGGLLAFRYDPSPQTFTRYWRSGTCPGGSGPPTTPDSTGGSDKWSGPSIHDLDDDGSPEIIYGGTVYRADGCLVSTSLGFPGYHRGVVPVIADVDEDGTMEIVFGNGIWEWNAASEDWVAEGYFSGSLAAGQVAVADMGNWPLASQGGQDRPEVVVIGSGFARVQTIEGTVVFPSTDIPGAGTGGPPTIADFDGDGRREFATANGTEYVVFDFDCLSGGSPAGCGGVAKTTGVLWSQPSQDASSNVTGSSVFDFDADGSAEAVYADECFLRIYAGATGDVLYSAARSSGTTYENPVIVDVDGDYRTEIVSAVNDYAGSLGCPATDPLLSTATYEQNHGIVVLRDELDRWAASRPVWSQHAYAVTHIGDYGETPQSSAVQHNWNDPDLNNFRQNVQGDLDALGDPDLTAGGDVGAVQCSGTVATIEARVCNRGTLPMVSGTIVAFFEDSLAGEELCRAPIPTALQVGECAVVSCDADLEGRTVDVFVMVDPDTATDECHENNNAALYQGVACGQIPY